MKNIVFDMGNVLINYDPEHFVARAGVDSPEDRELLLDAVFRSPQWPLLDLGEMDEAGLEAVALPRLPERLHAVARDLIHHWEVPMEPIPGMADFIRECRDRGCGVYLLSNASVRQREYWDDIPGREYFDGAVVSAYEHCVKPMPGIYVALLERYGLRAEDCLFVDDMQPNVDGAVAVGMRGFRFTGDIDALRRAAFPE